MKTVLGIILIIGGICAGLYVGVWWAFIGGIIQLIEAIRATELSAASVAFGVAKILFAGMLGTFTGGAISFVGVLLLHRK